jgi:dipeptidyl-peptidase-4
VFRSGVAGAPVTDWKFYDSVYTERYMGQPSANAAGYAASSPLAAAAALRADLLILHGTGDDNVHLANTIAFTDALAKAGRPYSLNLYPGQLHGFRDRDHRIARDRAILEHLERTLRP